MSHMVIYRGVDGKPGYHQTDDIHDAVGFVERMRNEEGVEHARIFRLEEVVFEYRPYYRVELTDSAAQATIASNMSGELPASDDAGAAQVGPGVEAAADAVEVEAEVVEDVDESIDVTSAQPAGAAAQNGQNNGEVTAEAGGSKKGLFGR